jgi:hypothetical protein
MNDYKQSLEQAPDISSASVMVEVSIGQPSSIKQDNRASREVTHAHNATTGSAKVKKDIYSSPLLKEIKNYTQQVYQMHRDMTLPYSDAMGRIVPTSIFPEHKKQIAGECKNEFFRMRDLVVGQYQDICDKAADALGSLHDPSDYLSQDAFYNKFRFNCVYLPVQTNKFHADLAEDTKAFLVTQFDKFHADSLNNMNRNICSRIHKAASTLVARINFTDAEKLANPKQHKLYDSAVTNVLDIVHMLDDFNVANDPNIARMADELRIAMRGVTPDGLKQSEDYRMETKKSVEDIIANLPSFK